MQKASKYFCERTAQYLSASEIGLCDVYIVWTVGVGIVSAKDLSTGDGVTSVILGDDCTAQHCNLLSVNSAYKKKKKEKKSIQTRKEKKRRLASTAFATLHHPIHCQTLSNNN